jgi:ketosteroid isomerase-like protein
MLFLSCYMKKIILPILLLLSFELSAQDKDKKLILDILERQTKAWNAGNLEQFMEGYWYNDSLMYVGKSGVTYGYEPTLQNYKKNYGSPDKMGQLAFEILHVNKLSNNYYQVVGKWHLKRTAGDVGGHYTLLFRKIKGEWKIVSDHSS